MSRYTLKTSTVFVSVNEETRVFHSVDEVPAEWRRRFEKARGGLKPQTILIADRQARREIMRALNGQPSALRGRWPQARKALEAAQSASEIAETGLETGFRWPSRQVWLEVAVAVSVAGAIVASFLKAF